MGSVCAGLSMLSCPSLTVYIIACIDLGVLRHHATPCDIVCQLSGFDSRQAGYSTYCLGRLATLCDIACQLSGFDSRQAGFQGLSAGHDEHSATRRTARYPAKAIEHGKDHGQRIDQEYHLCPYHYSTAFCPKLSQAVLNCFKFDHTLSSLMQ